MCLTTNYPVILRIASGQICNMHDITSGVDHASQLLVVLFIYTQFNKSSSQLTK